MKSFFIPEYALQEFDVGEWLLNFQNVSSGYFCTFLHVTLIVYLIFSILENVLDFYFKITCATF